MTAIIMAGPTGAAYAASIGTMQAHEEMDALKTMGKVYYGTESLWDAERLRQVGVLHQSGAFVQFDDAR